MLIKIGNCHLDPEMVSFVGVQEGHDGKQHIVIVLCGFAHPLVHTEYSGSPAAEVLRIADLLAGSIQLAAEDRAENRDYRFSEDGVDMIRMPISEHEDQRNTAYRAGWDDAMSAKRVVQVSEKRLGETAQTFSDLFGGNIKDVADLIKATYKSVAEHLGARVEWQE